MARIPMSIGMVLSLWILQAGAQLLSCTDIKCPVSYGLAKCGIDNTTLTMLGVSEFSSALDPSPLTWTVGYTPAQFTHTTDQRRYFLSTPKGLDLDTRTDISGCALFFTGIEAGLSFIKPNGSGIDPGTASGTCADALGAQCVSDLTSQAQGLVVNSTSSGNLECSFLAQTLQSSPPESCTEASTWGNIVAKSKFPLYRCGLTDTHDRQASLDLIFHQLRRSEIAIQPLIQPMMYEVLPLSRELLLSPLATISRLS